MPIARPMSGLRKYAPGVPPPRGQAGEVPEMLGDGQFSQGDRGGGVRVHRRAGFCLCDQET